MKKLDESVQRTPEDRDIRHVLSLLRDIQLQHPLFNSLTIEWQPPIYSNDDELRLIVYTRVPDRNAPSSMRENLYELHSTYDQRRYEPPRGVPAIVVKIESDPISMRELLTMSRDHAYEYLARIVRDTLIYACTHEIDEMIQVCGRRHFDPHR